MLSLLSQAAYKLLIDLSSPNKPEQKSYDEIKSLLAQHYSPQISVFKERYNFYEAVHSPEESVADWAAGVWHLAASCEFGEHFSFAVVDKFVMCFVNGRVKEWLFSENPKTLTIVTARGYSKKWLTLETLRMVFISTRIFILGRGYNQQGN